MKTKELLAKNAGLLTPCLLSLPVIAIAGAVLAITLLSLPADSPAAKSPEIGGFSTSADHSGAESILRQLRMPSFDYAPASTLINLWKRNEYRIIFLVVSGVLLAIVTTTLLHHNRRVRQVMRYNRSLIEASLDPLITISKNGKIMDVNNATVRITGVLREQLLGSNFSDYFTDPQAAQEGYRKVFNDGSVNDYPLAIRHRDGRIFDVLYNASLYRNSNGQVEGVFAAARDISERKRIEDALRDHEERLSLAARHNGVGIWDWNLQTQEMFWDDSMYALYHIHREDFSGTEEAWRQSLHPDDLERGDKEVEDAISGKKPFDTEFRVCWPTGEIRYIKAVAKVFRDDQGKPLRMLGTNIDITERKKMEDELRRSNAELDQFAYAVSHDMRQPLRMVTSYLSLLEKALAERLDEDTKQYLKFATDGAKRMDQMILSMLDYSRVGRKTDPITLIASQEVLNETLDFLKPDITSNGTTVEVTGEWPELPASRDELFRLLQNLIGNALKYREPNQPPRVEIHAATTPSLFRVTIRDHGIGIDPKHTDRLFKVFSRLQGPTRFEGTGVGLALCRKIVEHHGGRIGVESAGEGQGSTFWFELPRAGISAEENPHINNQDAKS